MDDDTLVIRLDNDAFLRCGRRPAADPSAIAFVCGNGRSGQMRWTLAGARLHLDGTFRGVKTSIIARRLDERDYPLMRGGFHVVSDR